MAYRFKLISAAVGVTLFLVIAIALLCSSFTDVEFHEMGFAKSKTTGTVDTSGVYGPGRQWLGPDKTMKKFDASGHLVSLPSVTVFAASDKLEITLGVELVYFLVPEDLKLLHDEYDINYQELMKASAQAALKDAANQYNLQDFYERREDVERGLHASVRKRLGGDCCPIERTVDDCIPRNNCTDKDKGLFVDVAYLQMTSISIPYSVEQRNLRALILTEETAKETFVQQAAVIEKETERLVAEIRNEADEVKANATANSQLIKARSLADYEKILEDARRQGLYQLNLSVGFGSAEHKNSFDYLRSLGNHNNAYLTVGFDQLIMGPTNTN